MNDLEERIAGGFNPEDITGMDIRQVALSTIGAYSCFGSGVTNAPDANSFYFEIVCSDEANAVVRAIRRDLAGVEWVFTTCNAGSWLGYWNPIDHGARWASMPKAGGIFTGSVRADYNVLAGNAVGFQNMHFPKIGTGMQFVYFTTS
ncbi:MAG: hypothetical protein ACK5L3_12210 [Oscillospiraceae bacterium]